MLKNIYKFLIDFSSLSEPTFFRSVEAKVKPFSKWLQIQEYHEPKTQNDRAET